MFTGLVSPTHLIIVLAILLLLFEAKRVPELARSLGSGLSEFKKGTQGKGAAELERDSEDRKES